jgi:peroxiredoxin
MKSVIKRILVLLFVAFLGFALWDLSQKIQEKKAISRQLAALPKLSVYHMDSTRYVHDALPDESTVIVYFNSNCDYCQREVAAFEEQLAAFGQANILFVSSEEIHAIREFSNQFDFSSSPNVQFLKIDEDLVYPTFGAISVPHLFIYSKNGLLVKEYKGETKIEAIVKYINTHE